MPLTDEQKDAYRKNRLRCPWCKSTQIESRDFEIISDQIYWENFCNDCLHRWDDIYNISDEIGENYDEPESEDAN